MKTLFSNAPLSGISDRWLLLLRVCTSAFMMYGHGSGTLAKLLAGGDIIFDDVIGIGPLASVILVVFAEIVCSMAVLVGFLTRLAIIPLLFTMVVAAFLAHPDAPFKSKELALLYLLIYGTLFIFGSGNYSLDKAIASRRTTSSD